MKATDKLPRHGDDGPRYDTDLPGVELPLPVVEGVTAYGTAALDRELAALAATPQGERNDRLNVAGFNLAQLVSAGHLEYQPTWDALYDTGVQVGLTQSETEGTIRSSFDAGLKLPRVVPERNGYDAHEPPPPPDPQDETGPEETPPTIGEQLPEVVWADFWADETREEWLVEPLIPARRLVAVFSPPKIGKSLLLLELAVAMAQGRAVFGQPAQDARHVLYVDFENDLSGDLRPRLLAMGIGPDDDLSHLHYLSFPTLPALDTPMGGLLLLAAVEWYGVDLVIIDTISRAVRGEENDNDTWLNFYRHTGVKLKAAGVACLRLDHTGKDETKGMRGGSAKAGDVDAAWFMAEVGGDVFSLDCIAHRLPIPTPNLVVTRNTRPRLYHSVAVGQLALGDAKVDAIVAWLDALEYPEDSPQRDAVTYAKDLGTCPHFSKNRVEQAQGKRSRRHDEYEPTRPRRDLE